MHAPNLAKAGVFLLMTSTLIACGQPYQATGVDGGTQTSESLSSAGPLETNVATALEKAQIASKTAQDAITDARAALSALSDSKGNIAINVIKSIFTTQVSADRGGLLAPLTNRLQTAFDLLFAKADQVKVGINTARLTLAVANSQLNLADPAQVILSKEILAQMAAIDAMEASLKSGMSALAGKVDQAEQGLSKLVSLGTSFIPVPGLNFVASYLIDTFVLGDVTSLLDGVKLKLLSL